MMKFKKPYAFLVAGLLCATVGAATIGLNSNVEPNVEPAQALDGYDWDFTTGASKNSNYTNTWEYDNVVSVSGAANNNGGWAYIRVGGKSNNNATSTLTSINPSSADISSVDLIALNTSSGSGYTLQNITLEVATDNSFTTIVDTITKSDGSISTDMNFAPSSGDCWASGSYFKMSFNWSNTTSKNRGMDVEKVVFNEKVSATDVLTGISYEGTPATQYNGRAFNPEGLTFYGNYSESGPKELDVSLITFTPETLTADTTEVIATFSGVSTTISDIKVNVLEGITYEGTPVDQYVNRPFDPTGLTFYANYSVTGKEEIDASLLTFDPEIMSLDKNSVTVYYEDVSTVINNITVLEDSRIFFGDHEKFATWTTSYTKHTLEYENFSVDFSAHNKQSSNITTMPVSKAGTVTITLDPSISATHEITYVEFGFVQWTTKKQTINLDNQTLSFPDDGTTISKTFSGHTTSVTAQATNSSNQIGWEYVIVTIEELEITPLMEAETFAQSVIDDLTCDPTGKVAPSTDEWSALAVKYETLSEDAKALFVDTTESSIIKDALAKYDYILGKYGSETYVNFMNREVVSAANNITNPMLNTTNNIIIIVSVCALAITAIGVFVIISKKRKEIKK